MLSVSMRHIARGIILRSISTIVNPLPRAAVEDAPFRFGISSMGVHRSFLTGSGTATPPPTTPGRMCSHHVDEVPHPFRLNNSLELSPGPLSSFHDGFAAQMAPDGTRWHLF